MIADGLIFLSASAPLLFQNPFQSSRRHGHFPSHPPSLPDPGTSMILLSILPDPELRALNPFSAFSFRFSFPTVKSAVVLSVQASVLNLIDHTDSRWRYLQIPDFVDICHTSPPFGVFHYSSWISEKESSGSPTRHTWHESHTCRQRYLRSYTFSKKEIVAERTKNSKEKKRKERRKRIKSLPTSCWKLKQIKMYDIR